MLAYVPAPQQRPKDRAALVQPAIDLPVGGRLTGRRRYVHDKSGLGEILRRSQGAINISSFATSLKEPDQGADIARNCFVRYRRVLSSVCPILVGDTESRATDA